VITGRYSDKLTSLCTTKRQEDLSERDKAGVALEGKKQRGCRRKNLTPEQSSRKWRRSSRYRVRPAVALWQAKRLGRAPSNPSCRKNRYAILAVVLES
jgi:hypothetical protein